MVEVEGTRVRLRSLTLEDVEPLATAADADPTNLGPGGDSTRERLRRQIERNPTLADGGFFGLAIEAGGELVGDVQARAPHQAFPPGVCEIGISLFPDARGRGLGREAVTLFTEHLLGEGVERVQASTSVDNAAMRRVLELVGYRFEGVLRAYGPASGGGREDYAMYAVAREDWPAAKSLETDSRLAAGEVTRRIFAAYEAGDLITTCAWCLRVEVDGDWLLAPRAAITAIDAIYTLSHSICPDCAVIRVPEA